MERRHVLGIPSCPLGPREFEQAPSLSYALQGPLCPRGYWGCEREWEGDGHKPNWGALRGQEKYLLLPCPLSPRESPKALGLDLHPLGPSLSFKVPSTLQDLLCLCRSYRYERKGVALGEEPLGVQRIRVPAWYSTHWAPGSLLRPQVCSSIP